MVGIYGDDLILCSAPAVFCPDYITELYSVCPDSSCSPAFLLLKRPVLAKQALAKSRETSLFSQQRRAVFELDRMQAAGTSDCSPNWARSSWPACSAAPNVSSCERNCALATSASSPACVPCSSGCRPPQQLSAAGMLASGDAVKHKRRSTSSKQKHEPKGFAAPDVAPGVAAHQDHAAAAAPAPA